MLEQVPRSADDLLRRSTLIETSTRLGKTLVVLVKEIGTDALYALNPGVNRWATDPEGPHRLLLPLEQAPAFATALAGLGERELVQWTRHRVRPGETIGGIAERYQTTAAVLRELNELRGNRIPLFYAIRNADSMIGGARDGKTREVS